MFEGTTVAGPYHPISFGEALKLFVAGSDEFGPDWHCAVLSEYHNQMRYAFGRAMMELDSKAILKHSARNCTIELETGGIMRFFYEENLEKMRGIYFTQLMWLYRPRIAEIRARIATQLRSETIAEERFRLDDVII